MSKTSEGVILMLIFDAEEHLKISVFQVFENFFEIILLVANATALLLYVC